VAVGTAVAAGAFVLVAALSGTSSEERTAAGQVSSQTPAPSGAANAITIYSSPTCGCCAQYATYLEDEGFTVTLVRTDGIDEIKDRFGIPQDMRSCHTSVIRDYFVEGHVPVAAIQKLLTEEPNVDGIALPGMPSGSPGMSGTQQERFVIYALAGSVASEFMRI
jgi:hypothetical protein